MSASQQQTAPAPRASGQRLVRSALTTSVLPLMLLGTAPAAQAEEATRPAEQRPTGSGSGSGSDGTVAPATSTYTVRRGDTLSEIAWAHRVPLKEVFRLNGMDHSTVIYAGQKITLPTGTAAPTSSGERKAPTSSKRSGQAASTYTVRRNDGWWIIAQRTGSTMAALQKANGMSATTTLHPGMVLKVPGAASSAPAEQADPAPTRSAGRSTALERTGSTSGEAVRYTVVAGDSPWRVAQKFGISVKRLRDLNGLSVDSPMYVGDVLVVDDGSPKSSAPAPQHRPIGNTFLHYTYPEHVTASANENYARLQAAPAPSPAETQQLIRETARSMGVDPRLALAHAYTESHFQHRSVSPANAIGTMQVIPVAGEFASQLVGRELNLLDPQDNVTAGVAIIRYMQENTPTRDLGIGAYYQGHGSVMRHGLKPDTAAYVARVKAAMAMF
ncbi:Membrane-bound lytic murein transglycosylase D precursor [Micrococcus lylae]|uniref:Membrane-bound lytic murein transglycosylase D n=1 Tax=Micrococcus lylae TaxID=1273 RepID=A0A1R4J7G9_9MICC|nr:LysM peptidoglycan-binding domain-containing protein [Micrococcus lylae]SJN27864.1 Membrane-bound lytic murein transglycosylase D precursor [Micrococcus lylae]